MGPASGNPARTIVRILIVDDAIDEMICVRDLLLREPDLHVHGVRDTASILSIIEGAVFDILLIDVNTWERDGRLLLAAARTARCDLPAMVLYGQDESHRASDAIRTGASGAIERNLVTDIGAFIHRVTDAIATIRAARRRETLARWMEREASFDHLTGLANRRILDEKLDSIEDASSANGAISIIVVDIEGLGVVNRVFGHHVGDELLRRASGAVARCVRATDLAARAGGDELAVVLPDSSLDVAQMLARRIGHEVERLNTEPAELPPLGVLFAVLSGPAGDARALLHTALEQLASVEHRPISALAAVGRFEETGPGVA